jgi:hypothetical protein
MKTQTYIQRALLSLFALTALLFSACDELDPIIDELDLFPAGEVCDGKKILSYASLSEIQSEHASLYTDYNNAAGDEQVLRDWEADKNFYSLRAKEEDMDNNVIPDDPLFDPWDYTSDDVMEAMLSEDGMIIIANELYLWSDGCLMIKTPFSCGKIEVLLDLKAQFDAFDSLATPDENLTDLILQKMETHEVEYVNNCEDGRYDFEAISAGAIDVNNQNGRTNRSNVSSCGTIVYAKVELIDNNPLTEIATLRIEAVGLEGNTTPMYYIAIDDPNANTVITDGSNPTYLNQLWSTVPQSQYLNFNSYPGHWVEIEVPYDDLNILKVEVAMRTGGFADNCIASDSRDIDLQCPLILNYEMIDPLAGKFLFTVSGLGPLTGSVALDWTFGDGNTATSAGNSVIHTYVLPCFSKDYTVTATFAKQDTMCKHVMTAKFEMGNGCRTHKIKKKKAKRVDGKRYKLKTKFKYNRTLGYSKFKNKFRWRKSGTKTITPISVTGFHKAVGSGCPAASYPLGTVSQSGKKTLRDGEIIWGEEYVFDKNNVFEIGFSHDNGAFGSKSLTYTDPCL